MISKKGASPEMTQPSTVREHAAGFKWELARICSIPWPALLATFACLLFLCSLFPFSGDDWYWGSSVSNNTISSLFANYNGRYLSNFLCIALTRVPILHAPVVAAVLLGIGLCMQKLVARDDTTMFWLCFFGLFLAPAAVLAQGLVWTSGFVNYTVSGLVVLLYILAVRGALKDDYRPDKKLAAPLFFLGLAGSLVVETLTVANIAAAFVMFVYTRRRHKVFDAVQVAFLVGAFAGAALMFSNGAYLSILQGNDSVQVNGKSYRQMAPGGVVHSAFACLSKSMSPYLIVRAWPMQALFCALAVLSYVKARRAGNRRRARALMCFAAVFSVVAVYGVWYSLAAPDKLSFSLKCANLAACLACAAALLAWCVLLWRDGCKKALLVFLYAVALALPLLVVSKYGPRCYLPSYILLVALACLLADRCAPALSRRFAACTCAAAALMFAVLVALYAPIHAVDVERAQLVEEAKASGSTDLDLPSLRAGDLVWHADPNTEMLAGWFRKFYGLDKGVEIHVQE